LPQTQPCNDAELHAREARLQGLHSHEIEDFARNS